MVVEAAPPDADASQVRDPDEEEEPDGRQNRFLENRRRAMALAAAGWPTRAEQVADQAAWAAQGSRDSRARQKAAGSEGATQAAASSQGNSDTIVPADDDDGTGSHQRLRQRGIDV